MSKWSLLREFYGITQDEIAKELDITKQAVSKFENDEVKKSRCEEFYTHKNLYRMFKNKYGNLEPIMDYVEFVLQSVDFDEIKKDSIYTDSDSLMIDGEFFKSEEYKQLKEAKKLQDEDNFTLEEMPFD